jgi:hypothetical protein
LTLAPASAASPTYDITTLAGKVASLHGTAGHQVRFSAFLEEEGRGGGQRLRARPDHARLRALEPARRDDHRGAQRPRQPGHARGAAERDIDRGRPEQPEPDRRLDERLRARTWSCDINGTPCSALADGYLGTYYSNDGGPTWCCVSSDPNHLGTLIPGVTRLTGGIYDAAGDPSVAFDSQGHVYYAGSASTD